MANIKPLTYVETAAFCSQMSMILKAGISSYEGLAIMADDVTEGDEKELLSSAKEVLFESGSFHKALDSTGVFPAYMLSMVQIGEETGRLDEVMESLAIYYEREAGLASTIKNAITYPCIMILMMLAVILVLMTKVMPVFDQVFRQLGSEMGGFSKAVLSLGNALNSHIMILVILLVLIAALGVFLTKSKAGQRAVLKFTGKFHFTNVLSKEIATYRFANGMALTLSSGLTPEDCLKLTKPLIAEGPFASKVDACIEKVAGGEDLCESLLDSGIFTGVYTKMASIAARTGVMDEVMKKIAAAYEEEIDIRISKILAAVEPTLVVILSIAVGIILLSVMLPLINIMSVL